VPEKLITITTIIIIFNNIKNTIPVGAIFFVHVQTGLGAHPTSWTKVIGSFPVVESGRGVVLTTHPLLAPRSRKGRAIPLSTL
jgi:hypothetical protein